MKLTLYQSSISIHDKDFIAKLHAEKRNIVEDLNAGREPQHKVVEELEFKEAK